MTQQEIKEAIKLVEVLIADFDLSDNDRNPLNKLINLAELHLSVMKLGIPKKKKESKSSFNEEEQQGYLVQDYEAIGFNQAIDDFTAYLAQKLSGLEGVIYKNSEDNGGCGVVINPEQLLTAIRKHLEVEKGRVNGQ